LHRLWWPGLLAHWKPDLPAVRFAEEQAASKRLSRLREQVVHDRTRCVNRLHACLGEAYGAVYKQPFARWHHLRPGAVRRWWPNPWALRVVPLH
jgi:hypothetical protein